MTTALPAAIANLYATFAQYPLRATMEGCPCCVFAEDQAKLSAKALKVLETEDISHYAWKAMSTWGDVEDFKHFLPRLLELIATTGIAYGSSVVLRKLAYAKWDEWTPVEKEAICSFLLSWWTDLVTTKERVQSDFTDLCQLFGDAGPLLKCWDIDFANYSFRNLVTYIQTDYYNLLGKKSVFKELDALVINQLLSWIGAKKAILEQGFYHFEPTDPQFAKEISDALYILDWVPLLESNQGGLPENEDRIKIMEYRIIAKHEPSHKQISLPDATC